MLASDVLPELNRKLDGLQAQATARLREQVGGVRLGWGWGEWGGRCCCKGCLHWVARSLSCALHRPLNRPLLPSCTAPLPCTLQGFSEAQTACQRFLNLRYDGTDVPIMTPAPPDGDYAIAFEQAYQVWVVGECCFAVGGCTSVMVRALMLGVLDLAACSPLAPCGG